MMFSKFILQSGKICLMLSLFLLVGCIAEDLSKCAKGISLKISLRDDVPGGPEAVKDVTLYVFDDNDLLLDIIPATPSEPILLYYPGVSQLHCVSWCNVQGGEVTMGPMQKGDSFDRGFVSLKEATATRAGETTVYASPSDLFYGDIEIENNTTSNRPVDYKIPVERMVASMNITVRGLQLLAGTSEGSFKLVIRETASRADFRGRYGGAAAYSPKGSFNRDGKEFTVPDFHLFPTLRGEGLTVELYHNETLLKSISADNGGGPIVPEVGKTLNLMLNFELSLNVEIEMTGWGERYIWKEWG